MRAKPRVVIDASVAVKWLHEEEKTKQALRWLDLINENGIIAFTPDLILYEISNALIRGIGKNLEEANEAIDILMTLPWHMVAPTADLLKDAMQFASERPKLSTYDAIYIALALHHDAVVITDDRKLHKIVGRPLTQLL